LVSGNNLKECKTRKTNIMKNLFISALGMIIGLLVLNSCENDGFYYQDEARIRLEGPYRWAVGTDSLEFSFITSPPDVSEITLEVSLHVMGVAVPHDRIAKIKVIEEKTTAESNQYSLPLQVIIQANELLAIMPLALYRTNDLQDHTVRLYLAVDESSDFKQGVIERSHLLVKWNDILSMPNNWDNLVEFFGAFSMVKYRFMINTLGVTEFDTNVMSWAQLMHYKIVLQNTLNEYNFANPGNPLRDENGQFVTF
jgi:hypothetical protein